MDAEYACPLCRHVSRSIKGYVNHSQLHSNEYRRLYECPFRGCKRKQSSYTGLRAHVYRDHQENSKIKYSNEQMWQKNVSIRLQCKTGMCKKVCDGLKDLLGHLRKHIGEDTSIECPFNQCSQIFSKKKTFSAHISRYHRYHTVEHLPSGMLCSSSSDFFNATPSSQEFSSSTANDVCDLDESTVEIFQADNYELFIRNCALFYLKLQSKCLLPSSVIQYIVQEFQNIHTIGFSYCLEKLTASLKHFDIPEPKIREIVSCIQDSDIFTKVNSGPLRSDFSRTTFYKEKFSYVEPQPHYLGRNNQNKECLYYYVPVRETLKCLFRDQSVYNEYKLTSVYVSKETSDSHFRDITDGLAFKGNELFKNEPNALRIMLYQDSFEVCNPLGASKKKHKIVGVYMTLSNFRPHLRSVVDNTLLVLLCKEVDLKFFGHNVIFHELVQDLKKIENDGILINNEIVKGTLCCIIGDNLGSHGIGGFTENFSTVEYFCRYCTVTLSEFRLDPNSVGQKRTVESYKSAIRDLESNHFVLNNVKGIKFDSAFNDLKYYHVCNAGLPPCLGHDIFEGVGDSDVAIILKHLIHEKGWLTYAELNHHINVFPYLGTDASSKPCQVSVAGDKLGGQAVQNWCLIRLLAVVIHDKIKNADEPVWQLYLLLHDIVEIVCAPVIQESSIAYLAILIDEYLEGRQSLFPNEKLKPKHHFLRHYPRLILQFGPLIHLWTLRFESKHCYFKRCIRSAQCFKNVCKTMSIKHQLLQAYKHTSSYFQNVIEVRKSIPLITNTYSLNIRAALEVCHIDESSEVSLEITVLGTLYKKGHYVVLNSCEYGLLFGEIQFVIHNSHTQVHFLVQEFKAQLSEKLHVYFISGKSVLIPSFKCVEYSELLDYYPLNAYSKGKHLMIPLKHAISSYSYEN